LANKINTIARAHQQRPTWGFSVTLEEQLIAEFATRLHGEVADALVDLAPDTPLRAHTALAEAVLGYLEEAGLVAEHDTCPHEDTGQSRSRILAYSLPDDSSRLELFTGAYQDEAASQSLTADDISRLAGRGARFFNYAIKGDHGRFADNDAVLRAARLIQMEAARIEDVRVHIITNAVARSRAVADLTVQGRIVEFSVWDLERLHRATGDEITRERIEVNFKDLIGRPIACLEMKSPPPEYQTFLLVLPGDLISKLYEQYGARLFEFNVRSFLQARGSVNKGLRDTIKNQPERFLAYNNGLTATADEIEVGLWHGETVIHRLKGLQIVNGAQTTASIHRAFKEKLPVDRLAVAMKLTRVEPSKLEEFVPLIARFANTQNPVQIADLSANTGFHIKLEQLAGDVWCPGEESRWFYERARGAYEVARARQGSTPAKRRDFDEQIPKRQVFGKTDLAKYMMSWWQRPDIVSRGAQKNFSAFMQEWRDRLGLEWLPDADFFKSAVAVALIFKAVQWVVRKAKLQSYGANVVTYMVAKLAADHGDALDLYGVWDRQEASPALIATFESWVTPIHSQLVTSAGPRNVTEWCKKDACWEQMKLMDLPVLSPLPSELLSPEEQDITVTEQPAAPVQEPVDTRLVEECCALDGQAWASVLAWAAGSTMVAGFDRRVATTITGLAIEGWPKKPTVKQAVYASRVLDAARRAGVIPT
jgi:hypothetical protein